MVEQIFFPLVFSKITIKALKVMRDLIYHLSGRCVCVCVLVKTRLCAALHLPSRAGLILLESSSQAQLCHYRLAHETASARKWKPN